MQPTLSPALRAAAISVANGAGHAAAGFLKGCAQDTPSWGSHNQGRVSADLAAASVSPRLLDEKDVVAPPAPATGTERPGRFRVRRQSPCEKRERRSASVVSLKEEFERCSVCTKEEFWVIYDIFAAMDRQGDDSIRRGDFVWALSAHGVSVDFQRIVRKAGLSAYFKATARHISLEDFMRRIFPSAIEIDILKMQRWTGLRKARNVLTSPQFGATAEEFRQVFSFLEECCTGTIAATDLLRAQILSRIEVLAVLPATVEWDLNFDEFTKNVVPVLTHKYVSELGMASEPALWEDSGLVHDGLHEHLEAVKHDMRLPFKSAHAAESSSPTHAAKTKVGSPRGTGAPAARPLPEGAVAELIRLLSVSPARQRCTSDMEPYAMHGMEHSSAVSAF